MKKFFSLMIILSFCLVGCNNTKTENSYNVTKISTTNNETNNTISKENTIEIEENIFDDNTTTTNEQVESIQNPETDIASFSTKIVYKDENRDNNMAITCSTLNGTIVKSGETFSFCNTVGKATPEKGYKEAEIFDKDGNIKKGYGGGNCQVSSTLYNAVLQVPTLTVVERHEHSRDVSYVEDGKDAAVAYGSIDFKFRNDNDYDIKIYSSSTSNSIDIRLVKI